MKQYSTALFLAIMFTLASISVSVPHVSAERGDTSVVRTFDKYLWTWYGSQSRWALFPKKDKKLERITMNFTLTCPTGGCGEWDYTMRVYARTRTGVIDSSLIDAPNFSKDGASPDSLNCSKAATFKTKYNATAKKTDTIPNVSFKVFFYSDNNAPFTVTDSISVFEAGYWNYYYSSNGSKSDSIFVKGDTSFYKGTRKAFKPFEVITETEIARFITPYGKWHNKDWAYTWTYDVTDYRHILTDSTEIRVFYDGWSQGSLFTLDFTCLEGIPARETYSSKVFWSGNPTYGDPNNPIENFLKPQKFPRLHPNDVVTLRLMTTGHGFGGTENAAEFSQKTHKITVNGTERFEQYLWRNDCGQNPIYPQAGTWYYNRAGWCPGDVVQYWDYNLTNYFSEADSVTVGYNMEPFENADLSKRASYIIEGQLLYSRSNYVNNASLEEIKMPNSDYKYRRMNPVCSGQKPIIVVKNQGRNTLNSLTIRYKLDNGDDKYFSWAGNIAFMESSEIELPVLEFLHGDHTFTVDIFDPNGKLDESDLGDKKTVSFSNPKLVTNNKVILLLKTDAVQGIPNGIRYEIQDVDGYVVRERGNFADGATIRDTVLLEDGCYKFIIYDEAIGDGLYPIFSGSTRGYYSLKDGSNAIIFNTQAVNYNQPSGIYASFGDREIIPFRVNSKAASTNETRAETDAPQLMLAPNPAISGLTHISLTGLAKDQYVQLRVVSPLGDIIVSEMVSTTDLFAMPLDLSAHPAGAYIIQIISNKHSISEKFIHLGN